MQSPLEAAARFDVLAVIIVPFSALKYCPGLVSVLPRSRTQRLLGYHTALEKGTVCLALFLGEVTLRFPRKWYSDGGLAYIY